MGEAFKAVNTQISISGQRWKVLFNLYTLSWLKWLAHNFLKFSGHFFFLQHRRDMSFCFILCCQNMCRLYSRRGKCFWMFLIMSFNIWLCIPFILHLASSVLLGGTLKLHCIINLCCWNSIAATLILKGGLVSWKGCRNKNEWQCHFEASALAHYDIMDFNSI